MLQFMLLLLVLLGTIGKDVPPSSLLPLIGICYKHEDPSKYSLLMDVYTSVTL